MVCGGNHIHVNLENVYYEGKEVLVNVDLLGGGRGMTITKMWQIRAIAKNKTDIEDIFMTLTFPPKTITKSKTCNGDERLAEEKGNKRKMSKLSERAFSSP